MAVTNVKPSLESGKLTLKNQKWEWKIIHHWVSFPTQIDKFWDTDPGSMQLYAPDRPAVSGQWTRPA